MFQIFCLVYYKKKNHSNPSKWLFSCSWYFIHILIPYYGFHFCLKMLGPNVLNMWSSRLWKKGYAYDGKPNSIKCQDVVSIPGLQQKRQCGMPLFIFYSSVCNSVFFSLVPNFGYCHAFYIRPLTFESLNLLGGRGGGGWF